MDIIFLIPIYKDYIWGGNRLKKEFNKDTPYEITAESWEISANKNGMNIISKGKWKGKSLEELFNNKEIKGQIFGNNCLNMERFPILIKFIDAKENLSVQVHPNNQYAQMYEKDFGKTETWYILDCKEKAKLICGLKGNVNRENIKEILKNRKIKDYLNYINIEKGDCIYITPGTVHAILSDVLVCEIQQNSDLTYRIYDWDRLDKEGNPRELHIDKAIETIEFSNKVNIIKENKEKVQNILNSKYFNVERITVDKEYKDNSNVNSFFAINIIDGNGEICYKNKCINIKKGDSFIIPAQLGEYVIKGKITFLKTYISKE